MRRIKSSLMFNLVYSSDLLIDFGLGRDLTFKLTDLGGQLYFYKQPLRLLR